MTREKDAWPIQHKLDENLPDKEKSYRRLKFGDIKGKKETAILTAQDQTISSNHFKNTILNGDSMKQLWTT
jgi:hypothetical protein